MATIRDVADAAGVSTATVSRALSGSGHVSEPTRQRVEAVAAAMGYVPNALARGLRGRTTRVVGIVVPQIDHFFYATVAQGVEAAARLVDFNVGDPVTIIEGAFATMQATISEITPESQKVIVMVELFGRETPVELTFAQIEKG